jgi:hypothetical protein
MPNPTVDAAIDECFDELTDGAKPRGVEQDGLNHLREQHRKKFKEVFDGDPEAWRRDGATVRRMSWYVGIFGRFFAETHGDRRVKDEHLQAAWKIVRDNCPALLETIAAKKRRLGHGPSPRFKYCP